MKQETLGFVGLGIMGSSMARNLKSSGCELAVYNRSADRTLEFGNLGIPLTSSPAELAGAADILLISVSDDLALREVITGKQGVLRGECRVSLIIDLSTTSPSTAREIDRLLAADGIGFMDAPVSGGDVGARNATLTIMAGGSALDFQRAAPYLEKIGKRIVHTGPVGSGQMTKAVNQVVVALNVAAMTEGLVLAKRAGLDLQKTLDTISSGAAGSWSLTNYGPRILQGDLKPGFRAEHMLKDLRILIDEAGSLGVALPVAGLVKELYSALCSISEEELGNHALIKLYERLGG